MPFEIIEQDIESVRTQMRADFQVKENALYIPLLRKRFSTSKEATNLEVSLRDFLS